jgi:hypothetical protein
MPIFQDDFGNGRTTPPGGPSISPALHPRLERHHFLRRLSDESIRTELCEGPISESPDVPQAGLPHPEADNGKFTSREASDRGELIERLKRGVSPTWVSNRKVCIKASLSPNAWLKSCNSWSHFCTTIRDPLYLQRLLVHHHYFPLPTFPKSFESKLKKKIAIKLDYKLNDHAQLFTVETSRRQEVQVIVRIGCWMDLWVSDQKTRSGYQQVLHGVLHSFTASLSSLLQKELTPMATTAEHRRCLRPCHQVSYLNRQLVLWCNHRVTRILNYLLSSILSTLIQMCTEILVVTLYIQLTLRIQLSRIRL